MATAGIDTLDTASLQALLGPQLTEEQARLIYAQGPEAVVFALLSLAKQLAEKTGRGDEARPGGTVGANTAVRQAGGQDAVQAQRGQAGTSRASSPRAASD